MTARLLLVVLTLLAAGCAGPGSSVETYPAHLPRAEDLLPELAQLPTDYRGVSEGRSMPMWEGALDGHQAVFGAEGPSARTLVAVAWVFRTEETALAAYLDFTSVRDPNATEAGLGDRSYHVRSGEGEPSLEHLSILRGPAILALSFTADDARTPDVDLPGLGRALADRVDRSAET